MDVPQEIQTRIKNNLLYQIALEWCEKNNIAINNYNYIEIVSKKQKRSTSCIYINQIYLINIKEEKIINIKRLILRDMIIKKYLLAHFGKSKTIKKFVNEF